MVFTKQNPWRNIRNDIMHAGEGKVYVLSDFVEYDNYETVKKALQQLCKESILIRLLPGVYYRPTYDSKSGMAEGPDIEAVAKAIARNNNWTIIPEGEKGLHLLGITTEEPVHVVYITNGTSKKYEVANQTFEFRHVQPKNIVGLSEKTALVVEALKKLGEKNINEAIIERLQAVYTTEEKQTLLDETKKVTQWIRRIMIRVAQ